MPRISFKKMSRLMQYRIRESCMSGPWHSYKGREVRLPEHLLLPRGAREISENSSAKWLPKICWKQKTQQSKENTGLLRMMGEIWAWRCFLWGLMWKRGRRSWKLEQRKPSYKPPWSVSEWCTGSRNALRKTERMNKDGGSRAEQISKQSWRTNVVAMPCLGEERD